jgi:hypothetical protein
VGNWKQTGCGRFWIGVGYLYLVRSRRRGEERRGEESSEVLRD